MSSGNIGTCSVGRVHLTTGGSTMPRRISKKANKWFQRHYGVKVEHGDFRVTERANGHVQIFKRYGRVMDFAKNSYVRVCMAELERNA